MNFGPRPSLQDSLIYPKISVEIYFGYKGNIGTTLVNFSLVNLIRELLNSCIPADNHLFKVNNGNTRTCEICSKLTIKTPEVRQWCHSGVFIVNFEHILHHILVFLLLTLSR